MTQVPKAGTIAANLGEIRERIGRAATNAGRDPSDITLVAVTKTVPAERVMEAIAAGARDLGENRAQELVAKSAAVDALTAGSVGESPPPRWHFIGRLQRNKVRMLAPTVDLWHSIDRAELVAPLARFAPGARALVEVNLSDEPQKGGCREEETPALVDALGAAGVLVEGLMTVPAAGVDPRPTFARLRELALRLELDALSMGMTSDFETAVAEGATIVRVGSAIFGPRSGAEGLRR